MDKKCENCRMKSYYVKDPKTDEWICTTCGTVVRKWWIPSERNVSYAEQPVMVSGSSDTKNAKNKYHQLMVKAFPKEDRINKRKDLIKKMCYKIDASTSITNRALMIYEKHIEELSCLNPIKKMLLACVIVATKTTPNQFIPSVKIKRFYDCSDINRYIKEICRIIGINIKTLALKSVPYIISHLMLPYKCGNDLIKNYEKASLIAPAVSSETRMGVATCKLLKDRNMKIDYEYVANLTDTTETSIKSFKENIKKTSSKR